MPTARARYRRRPVYDQLARGQVERWNPGGAAGTPDPPVEGSALLLTTGDFLLLTDGTSHLLLAE